MDQSEPIARTTARYAQKREAILHSAAQLFNQYGIKGATLADVASRVGLSTNSITYYYKKKEDLIVACLLQSIEVIRTLVLQAAVLPTPQERVHTFISLSFERLAQIERGEAPAMMTFRDAQSLGSPHAEVIYASYTDLFRATRRLLAGEGPLPSDRVALNARTHLLLTLTVTAIRWCGRYDPNDYALLAEQVGDILLRGIGTAQARWGETELDDTLAHTEGNAPAINDAFLRAATALINELGYRGASVDRISARLNVTKGSFYHHNPSKEELICACFERTFAITRMLQLRAREGTGSGWDKLCALGRALVRYQFSEQGPLLRMSAWSELPTEIRERKLRIVTQLDQRYASFLVEGMQDGSIRALDQAVAGYLVTGMVNASVVLQRWVPTITADQAVEQFVRALFMGLLAD
ncbi:MAG TPA: TetR/AcrR family transcriptional regulator [Noviherbaspirillum sp.]